MEPLTLGLIIGGGGAWLADKVLGPSAEALGREFQAYSSDRVRRIFSRAKERVSEEAVQPLPPGFAMHFLQRASFSEDDDLLTDCWANLLANAAVSFSSRHAAYTEILSQLSPYDARLISDLVPENLFYSPQLSSPVNLKLELKLKIAKQIKSTSDTHEEGQVEFNRLMALDLEWPGRITAARVHYRDADRKTRPITGGSPDQFVAFDYLTRLGLIDRFDIDISMSPYETGVEGVLVTMLGIGFVQTCRNRVGA